MARTKLGSHDPLETIVVDRSSPVPLYYQLAQQLESQIAEGKLVSGDRLENEVRIAEALGLSRPTVRQAFRYLVDKGLVTRRRGQGTVIAEEKVSRQVTLTSLYDDLESAGKKPTTEVIRHEVIHASDLVKEALGLDEGAMVIALERLRSGGGEPIALMHNFLPATLLDLSTDRLREHGLYALLRESNIFPSRAYQRMGAKNASLTEARLLHQSKGTALLTMERTTFDDRGRAIEFAQHVYCASRYFLYSTVSMDVSENYVGRSTY